MSDYPDPTFSRRSFATAIAAGSLLAGFSRSGAGAPFANLPQLDGELSFDPALRAEYANDYGRIVHEQPLAVLRPGSVRDIASIVTFARRFGLKIAARGQGHQPFGQAQVSGGIVIDMRSLQQVHTFTADSVEVDAGTSWRALLQATLSYGLAPPVLTKFLGLTVGGTLSIGGVGVDFFAARRAGRPDARAASRHGRRQRRRLLRRSAARLVRSCARGTRPVRQSSHVRRCVSNARPRKFANTPCAIRICRRWSRTARESRRTAASTAPSL